MPNSARVGLKSYTSARKGHPVRGIKKEGNSPENAQWKLWLDLEKCPSCSHMNETFLGVSGVGSSGPDECTGPTQNSQLACPASRL